MYFCVGAEVRVSSEYPIAKKREKPFKATFLLGALVKQGIKYA